MDRLLRPKVFETESTDSNAEKLYKHWKMTLENYIETTIPVVTPGTPSDEASMATASAAVEANNRKKRFALINNISADIFDLISDCTDYDSAMQVLDSAYIRPTSVVYNRHKLISNKQNPDESIDTFKQGLLRIAKTCNFQAVSAEENKMQYVRDAFINGIAAPHIRQRLLENVGELTLDQAFTQARALEQAQSQSVAYESNTVAAFPEQEEHLAATGYRNGNNSKSNYKSTSREHNNTGNSNNSNSSSITNSNSNPGQRVKCYFCGNPRHPRTECPAREQTCSNCRKKGHYKRVCQSDSYSLPLAAVESRTPSPSPYLA